MKEKIVEIMEKLLKAGSIVPLISLYGKVGDIKKADALLQKIKDNGIERTADVCTDLIYCHERDLSKVDSLFKEMVVEGLKPNVTTYNTMIDAFSKGGNHEKAVELLSRMKEEGIKPNVVTYNSLIKCHELDLSKVDSLFNEMIEERIKPTVVTYTSLIKCHGRDLSKVDSLFQEMIVKGIKPRVFTYNILIKCHERVIYQRLIHSSRR
jgi:pentatricopeptide repeat protein